MGIYAINKNGKANPILSAEKTTIMLKIDCVNAKPIATAINGAVHGVAITTAKSPVKKSPYT